MYKLLFIIIACFSLSQLAHPIAFAAGTASSVHSQKKVNDLRSMPVTVFTDEEAKNQFQLNDRFRPLKYSETRFKLINDSVVIDTINGLMWQKSGSTKELTFKQAQKYIENLNEQNFSGNNDWRLPTLEELLTLLLKKKSQYHLFVDSHFSNHQRLCWSSDIRAAKTPFGAHKNSAWGVDFSFGYVFWGKFDSKFHVRAMRKIYSER